MARRNLKESSETSHYTNYSIILCLFFVMSLHSLNFSPLLLLNISDDSCMMFFPLIFFFFFLAVLVLRCCARAFSSCGEQGLLFVVMGGLLIAVAPLVAEHGL